MGYVTTLDGRAIAGARVVLYGRQVVTDANGCFTVGGPDALPFTLDVSAPRHKSTLMEAQPGFFSVQVKPALIQASEVSHVKWNALSGEAYEFSGFCKPN